MTSACLYIGDSLTDEMALQLVASDGGVVLVNRHSDRVVGTVTTSLHLNLGSVEGQARLLDWLRQNERPTRIFCELQVFELETGDTDDTLGATDYLSVQIIGVTRLLEAALSLHPDIAWVFIQPLQADVWSRACEAYFRVLIKKLRVAAPSAHFDFRPPTDWLRPKSADAP